jgi:hypothetical protein
MSTPDPPPVVPNPGLPKMVGILNVAMGSLLLLCGICSGLSNALNSQFMTGAFSPFSVSPAPAKSLPKGLDVQKTIDRQKAKSADDSAEDSPGASPAQAPATVAPAPTRPGITMSAAITDATREIQEIDKTTKYFMLTDTSVGIVLSIAMIVAGAGLNFLKEWARQMAIWVAGLKSVWMLILCAIFLIWIVPRIVADMNLMFDKMAEAEQKERAQQAAAPGAVPAAPAPTVFSNPAMRMTVMRTVTMFQAGYWVVGTIVGLIVPCITLVMLMRPSARAACAPGPKVPFEEL